MVDYIVTLKNDNGKQWETGYSFYDNKETLEPEIISELQNQYSGWKVIKIRRKYFGIDLDSKFNAFFLNLFKRKVVYTI